jgi:hypothetical protein
MAKILIAFDLYGTLLSPASIAKKLAGHFGQEKADSIAAVWRKYQLEYTWRLNSMSRSTFIVDVFSKANFPQSNTNHSRILLATV